MGEWVSLPLQRRALSADFDAARVKVAEELLDEFPAFHWPLRSPEIAARGGFDCFVGNPAWEQFEKGEQEWFESSAPDIAALKGAERKTAKERLRTDRPGIFRRWRICERSNQRMAEFNRTSGRYTAVEGKANTYMLFAELVADALRPNRRTGIIVKTALGTDKGAMPIFHKLVRADQIEEFHDHVNGGPTGTSMIFADVDAKERFVVLGLQGAGAKTGDGRGFQASIMNWSVDEAPSRPRQNFTFEILKTLNPKTATLTSFWRGEEFEIALSSHRRSLQPGSRLALLDFDKGGSNP